jgi:hypothetical protein
MKTPYKVLIVVGVICAALFLLRYLFGIGTIAGALLIGVAIGYFIGKNFS